MRPLKPLDFALGPEPVERAMSEILIEQRPGLGKLASVFSVPPCSNNLRSLMFIGHFTNQQHGLNAIGVGRVDPNALERLEVKPLHLIPARRLRHFLSCSNPGKTAPTRSKPKPMAIVNHGLTFMGADKGVGLRSFCSHHGFESVTISVHQWLYPWPRTSQSLFHHAGPRESFGRWLISPDFKSWFAFRIKPHFAE